MFRSTLLILTALTIALPAAAQTRRVRAKGSLTADSSDSEMQMRRRRVMSPYLMNGFGVGLSLLNTKMNSEIKGEIDMSAFGIGKLSGKLPDESNTGTNPGLVLGYSLIQRLGVGFIADVTFSQVEKMAEHKNSFIRPAVSLAFGAASNFYGFAGINTISFAGEPTFTDGMMKDKSLKLNPTVGWQVGGGFISQGFEGRLQYSASKVTISENMTWSNDVGQSGPISFDGFYDFAGLELSMLYRF